MSLTPSTMLALKTKAPDFSLTDVVSGKKVSLTDFSGRDGVTPPLLVMFICRHCPYVQHIKAQLSQLGRDYQTKELGIVAISSNDAKNYREDSPANLKEFALEIGLIYPLCYDESQCAAKSFTAACTPDFFLFNAARELVYRGQLDDSRPGNGKPVTGRDLRDAIEAVLTGRPVGLRQKPSRGCNIKWKPGNEPGYFNH
ncbi:MAG: thioredoxin family protein [Candidatus Omnitrophica bacterium CG07_land_8_20_14_0_80_50_8]|nr:MAG: thioredoxin family protein [Candidatus Omnitrophica bacterium CG07_land_8_20_14_0_80_50_8]